MTTTIIVEQKHADEVMRMIHGAIGKAAEYQIPGMSVIGMLAFYQHDILARLREDQLEKMNGKS